MKAFFPALFPLVAACSLGGLLAACSSSTVSEGAPAVEEALVLRSDIVPVTRVEDAKPGVFIPPFADCRSPIAGDTTSKPDGKVCSNVSLAGATEPGKAFSRYASCDVVRTQRPYYPSKPAKASDPNDPRLTDKAFMDELAWAKSQIAATGCVCCHDASIATQGASQWDIGAGPIWLDTLSDSGLALFAGLADSSVLGAYPPAENHGFDRNEAGIPTTDTPRMKRFLGAELTRRGISEAKARAIPPFGGPIYDNAVRPPTHCGAGEGIEPDGRIAWNGGNARYVYVLAAGSKNPGVPPNFDRPAGTMWRLDVLPSADAIATGLRFGTTPKGSYQDIPVKGAAQALEKGRTYQLSVLKDVGVPLANCLFTFGSPVVAAPKPDAGPASAEYGAPCTSDASCAAPATYCAKMPGASAGYCTRTGCKEDPSVCPAGWGCFDASRFQPGAPAFCSKP